MLKTKKWSKSEHENFSLDMTLIQAGLTFAARNLRHDAISCIYERPNGGPRCEAAGKFKNF
jgi:hypothetical protein